MITLYAPFAFCVLHVSQCDTLYVIDMTFKFGMNEHVRVNVTVMEEAKIPWLFGRDVIGAFIFSALFLNWLYHCVAWLSHC